MKTKEEYLKDVNLIEFLPKEIIAKTRVQSFKKGEIIEMGAFVNGRIWNLIEGTAKVTIYNQHKGEYYGEFSKGEWVGVAGCLMDIEEGAVDIEAKDHVIAMSIPLKELIENYPEKTLNLWEKIAKSSAKEFTRVLGGTLARAILSNEDYFLKYLKDNNMKIFYKNTRELSEFLNTNLRTLQRILRKLTNENVIKRTKHEIWVIDEEKLEDILNREK